MGLSLGFLASCSVFQSTSFSRFQAFHSINMMLPRLDCFIAFHLLYAATFSNLLQSSSILLVRCTLFAISSSLSTCASMLLSLNIIFGFNCKLSLTLLHMHANIFIPVDATYFTHKCTHVTNPVTTCGCFSHAFSMQQFLLQHSINLNYATYLNYLRFKNFSYLLFIYLDLLLHPQSPLLTHQVAYFARASYTDPLTVDQSRRKWYSYSNKWDSNSSCSLN